MTRTILNELSDTAQQARRALRFLSLRQRGALALALGMMFFVGFLNARIPLILGDLIDRMLKGGVTIWAQAAPYIGAVAVSLVLREIIQVARRMLVENTATRVERDATVLVVGKLLIQEIAVLRGTDDGALNGRVARSVAGLVKLLKLSFLDAFPAMATAAFALAAAIQKNLVLGLLMASIMPIGFILVFWQLSTQRGIRLQLIASKEQMDGLVVEQLGGIESIRAAHTVDIEVGKVAVIANETQRREFRHHVAMALFDGLKSLNEGAFYVAVLAVALGLALQGVISAGDILAFSMLFAAVLAPMRDIHRILDEAHESGLRAAAFFELVDRPSDISFAASPTPAAQPTGMFMVEATDLLVTHRTADGEEVPALNGVSFTVSPGEVVGIAGPSGSGKSTLSKALLRLAHPRAGQLRVGGVDIADLARADIGRWVGYVGQDPYLFGGTVADNIAYGAPQATPAAVEQAARLANIHAEIGALQGGYEFVLAARGRNLSGGQRQRIALARVFLQQPPLLILDEATAALDNQNERAVMAALERAVAGRTVIMIAHRLSSLQRTDRILVLERGRIVESGPFSTLAAQPGGVFNALLNGNEAKGVVEVEAA